MSDTTNLNDLPTDPVAGGSGGSGTAQNIVLQTTETSNTYNPNIQQSPGNNIPNGPNDLAQGNQSTVSFGEQPGIDEQKAMNEFVKGTDYENHTLNIFNDISVEKGVLNFSKTINADLIGISTHGRQGIAHFFNGSISEDLVNHAKRPVITFKI